MNNACSRRPSRGRARTTTAAARHRAHRRAAWTRLRAELRTAGRADLWRYTADLLYLVENPIVRDAFFPSGSDELTIEPARAADLAGMVQGFSSLCQPQDVSRALLRSDPVTAAWMEHLRRAPVPSPQRVLFNRHALACGDTATARLWLDVKRAYLELRPHLRRLYTPVRDVERVLTVLAPLGFAPLPGAPIQIGRDPYWSLMNDFGPGSIDGWLSEVVGRELAAGEATVLDPAARRLVLDGRAVDLSRLELDVRSASQQFTHALSPWDCRIRSATAVCSAGEASWGSPVPPYAAQVLGMI